MIKTSLIKDVFMKEDSNKTTKTLQNDKDFIDLLNSLGNK